MKIDIVSRKLIKPCTPTPQNLYKYEISFTDEDLPQMNVGVILFYNLPIITSNSPNRRISRPHHQLEESLSEILPKFYPLAGRYMKNDHYVDCSDQGAEFLEAEALDVELADILLGSELLNDLFPSKFYQVYESPGDPLLWVQITEFKCGGLAISVTISHRIFDGSSLGTFIAAWSNANNNNNSGDIIISPSFDSPSLFPRQQSLDHSTPTEEEDLSVAVKRLSFNKEAIASLRSKLAINSTNSRKTKTISRVRVVSAALAKALIGVDRAKHEGNSRPCLISQAVNIRGRTIPPLPDHSCGNLSMLSLTRCMMSEDEIVVQELVDVLGESLEKTVADCAEILSPSGDAHAILVGPLTELMETLSRDGMNVIMFSDWSKFGFSKVDFGWEQKPAGVAIGPVPGENLTVLMDDKEGDGLEAWVHLNADDMPYFDREIKLLTNVCSSSLVYDLRFQFVAN